MPKQYSYILIIGGAVIFTVLVFFIILFILFYQRKQQRNLAEQQELRNSFQRELLKTQLETQEQTLRQIGEELHDNIGQLLGSTRILLAMAEREIPNIPNAMHTANDTLGKAIQELRTLAKLHNSEWLNQFDLVENVASEVSRIRLSGLMDACLEADEQPVPLSNQSQVMVFRVIQEALQNCIKHAGANRVFIKMEIGDQLKIRIADNGQGFDVQTVSKTGVGILNMKRRIQMLGGEIDWHAGPGSGTEVAIQLPL